MRDFEVIVEPTVQIDPENPKRIATLVENVRSFSEARRRISDRLVRGWLVTDVNEIPKH